MTDTPFYRRNRQYDYLRTGSRRSASKLHQSPGPVSLISPFILSPIVFILASSILQTSLQSILFRSGLPASPPLTSFPSKEYLFCVDPLGEANSFIFPADADGRHNKSIFGAAGRRTKIGTTSCRHFPPHSLAIRTLPSIAAIEY